MAQRRLALIDLLCNGAGPVPLPHVISFDLLKYKVRDELETIFKSWAEGVPYDVEVLRDHRLRHNHGIRYDARTNLADWDFQAVVRKNAGVVAWQLYRDWRNTGRAFEYGDQTYDAPNRTMASYVEGKERGLSTERRGFWGDTAVSPYFAVGGACYVPTDEEAKAAALAATLSAAAAAAVAAAPVASVATGNHAHQLFEISSRHSGTEQWRHHAVEIATYNLVSWLHEIETGRQYVMQVAHDVYSGLADTPMEPVASSASTTSAAASSGEGGKTENDAPRAAAGALPSSSSSSSSSSAAAASTPPSSTAALSPETHAELQAAARAAAMSRARTIARAFRGVKITFMTGDFAADILDKKKMGGMFHAVHASTRAVHLLANPGFCNILSPFGAVLVTETVRNVVSLKADQRDEYARRVLGVVGRAGGVVVGTDRTLSADTFAVGSVIELSSAKKPAIPAGTTPFECSVDGSFAGLPTTASHMAVGDLGGAKQGTTKPILRVKDVGMSAFSQNPAPLPAVAALQAAVKAHREEEQGQRAGSSEAASSAAAAAPEGELKRAARAATESLRAHIRGVAAHQIKGGDNPFPEALVFAYVPLVSEEVARCVKEVIDRDLVTEKDKAAKEKKEIMEEIDGAGEQSGPAAAGASLAAAGGVGLVAGGGAGK